MLQCLIEFGFAYLYDFSSKGNPYQNIIGSTTAGDSGSVVVVECHPALHYILDIIFLSFGIMNSIVKLGSP